MKHTHMGLMLILMLALAFVLTATACEPLIPTAAYIVISETPPPATITPTPTITLTPTITPTPTATGIPTETPTPTPPPCEETQGFILELAFESAVEGGEVIYHAYLPPCYMQTQHRYPYVILLHGQEGAGQPAYDSNHWLNIGVADAVDRGIVLGHLPPMVLIMPDGGQSMRANNFESGQSFESLIMDELIPTLEDPASGYCLWTAREGRAIGGISRGGFWAFEIAFRHPETFSIVGGHSPFFDEQVPEAYNPLYMAENAPKEYLTSLRMMVDHGADDYVQNTVRQFSDLLSERQISHDYVVNPTGEHSDDYWESHVTEYLAFYGKDWPKDAYALPSCKEPIGDGQ